MAAILAVEIVPRLRRRGRCRRAGSGARRRVDRRRRSRDERLVRRDVGRVALGAVAQLRRDRELAPAALLDRRPGPCPSPRSRSRRRAAPGRARRSPTRRRTPGRSEVHPHVVHGHRVARLAPGPLPLTMSSLTSLRGGRAGGLRDHRLGAGVLEGFLGRGGLGARLLGGRVAAAAAAPASSVVVVAAGRGAQQQLQQ